MAIAVHEDAHMASEQFLEVIFADPELFEEAFAAVRASWSASPPRAPVTVRTARASRTLGVDPLEGSGTVPAAGNRLGPPGSIERPGPLRPGT